jgi:hypothetical protein
MKKSRRFLNNLEDHKKRTLENLKYSLDRFDILIISISSGGLIFSMGFIKDILPKTILIQYSLLKISWILFGSAIVLNLLSQVTGYYANKFEIKITKNLIRQEREKETIGNQKSFESIKSTMDFFTKLFNGLSLFFLIAGIVIFVIFMSKTI